MTDGRALLRRPTLYFTLISLSPALCHAVIARLNPQTMTSRSLFTIILKVLGLLFLKEALVALPTVFQFLIYTTQAEGAGENVLLIVSTILGIMLYGLIPYSFIFKSRWLIDKLKLDQGFDQEIIPLAAHRSTILSIAIIVIGGMLVATELPNLIRFLFNYSQERRDGQMNPDTSYLLLTAARIVIGMLLISKQRQLVSLIEYQQKRQ
ncbi:MAG: hypothetical protein H7Z21_03020 [Hymenobacter sp.]|nr:hypothetical protein [Hymenobacter sp.]